MGNIRKVSIVAGSAILPTRVCSAFSHIGWVSSLHASHQRPPLSTAASAVVPVTARSKSRSLATTVYCAADTEDDSTKPTTLLIGSQQDAASCAILNALLAKGNWLEATAVQETIHETNYREGQIWKHATSPVSLWSVQGSLLDLDDADRLWTDQFPSFCLENQSWRKERPSDVIFLSKHVARSGTPALCVHPIGLADVS